MSLVPDSWNISERLIPIRKNFAAAPVSMTVLLCAIILGCVEYLLWGRTHLEDGVPLIALLVLAAYDRTKTPLQPLVSPQNRIAGWCFLIAALAGICSPQFLFESGFISTFAKNFAILCIALGFSVRHDGRSIMFRLLPLFLLAILIIPFYEYLLLELSYPLRLISTAISSFLLTLCGIPVDYDGTSMIWNGQVITITDACSGISLLGLLFFLEYLIARAIDAAQWKKWCWGSLVVIWIIIGNALRLLVTLLLYRVFGQRVFERELHLILGCFFVVVTSLLIWLSSLVFSLDRAPKEKE